MHVYNKEDIQHAFQELEIKPIRGKITTRDAAKIMTWRVRREQGIEHEYTDMAVRRHVVSGNLTVAERINKRLNLYKPEAVFSLPLAPKRANENSHNDVTNME